MKNKYKTLLFKIFIVLNILSLSTPSVCSAALTAGDIGDAIAASLPLAITLYLVNQGFEMFEEYFSVDDQMAKTIGNFEQKVQAPEVNISFSPEIPVPGQKVTAFAQPKLFSNPTDKLFYTWMLKHDDGIDADAIDEDDLEEYKINAAKIIGNAGFDWIEATKNDAYANGDSDDDYDGYDAEDFFGGEDQRGKDNGDYHCFVLNKKTGYFYPDDSENGSEKARKGFDCEHLFPKECDGHDLGDGEFTNDEEKCWTTNPYDEDTSNSGIPDEATVLGLGMNTFSWIYQAGDVVGLAVEGVSMNPTKLKDNSYRIMWAFSGDGCPRDDDTNNDLENMDDVNEKCLPHSFVDPTSKGPGEAIDVSLSFFPDSPTISTPEERASSDLLSITADVSEASRFENLLYDWKVYGVDDLNETDADKWVLLNTRLQNATPFDGANVDSLKFGLVFDEANTYNFLKVSVNVLDSASDSEGTAYTFIPLSSIKENLKVYSVAVSGDDPPALTTPGQPGCLNPNKICQVSFNEIVSVEASDTEYENFSWTINGKPLASNPNGEVSDNKIYFPVTEKAGTEFILTMTANKVDDGEKVVLKKTFAVMEPVIEISSTNPSTCERSITGYFKSFDGTEEKPEYDDDQFEATPNSVVQLKATFLGPHIDNYNNLKWTLPDADIFGQTAQFTTGISGDSHVIDASMHYGLDLKTQKALLRYWGISYNESNELDLSARIYISVEDAINADYSAGGETVRQNGQKPLASLISGLPAYLIFLFKIILTIGLLIFSLGVFSSLAFNREKD